MLFMFKVFPPLECVEMSTADRRVILLLGYNIGGDNKFFPHHLWSLLPS